MTFEIILTGVFLFMSVYSFAYVKSRLGVAVLIAVYLVATIFIWAPDYSTEIANYVGIGRGVDFVLIVAVVSILNIILVLARHLYTMNRQLTLLARRIGRNTPSTRSPKGAGPGKP
jgi:small membrane protein